MSYYTRDLGRFLRELAGHYPVVSVTGPRQSGKSTLVQAEFPHLVRVSLETLDHRTFAKEDPRGFLKEYKAGAIIDEIQHCPELLSYLQEEVDLNPAAGRFILTGSEHLSISASVAQSLAGRCGISHLLPLSHQERLRFPNAPEDWIDAVWEGGYPRISAQAIPAQLWLRDYISTYLQRDVRQLLNIKDLNTFGNFLSLCAASTSAELNLSRLSSDTGVSHNTIKAWISVLEASFLCFRLPAWTPNIRKQWVKAPKLHFYDTGLVCQLLGIRSHKELVHHPLRGAIFETWVASELMKNTLHRLQAPSLWHLRATRGLEIDLLDQSQQPYRAIEVKSGATIKATIARQLQQTLTAMPDTNKFDAFIVYTGDQRREIHQVNILPWQCLYELHPKPIQS